MNYPLTGGISSDKSIARLIKGGTITDIYDTATKITDVDTHSIERR